ncbi:DUF7220 family protein [Methylomarinum roseum]|uniref:DUF7220 family protein n=1 Tax=Methylomarinum roseum TaxID=3067653 RepID=UPI003D7EFC15
MTESRKDSFIESLADLVIGYLISLLFQLTIFYFYQEIDLPQRDNMTITLWFTMLSLGRSYLVRRYFNRKAMLASMKL